MVMLENIVTRISPVVLILVCPLASPNFDVHASGLINILKFPIHTMRWNIVPGYTGESRETIYCTSIIFFLVKESYHTEKEYDFQAQRTLAYPNNAPLDSVLHVPSPVCPGVWYNVLEFVCHDIIAPHIDVELENHPIATVYHTKPSPKHQDWVDSYKSDSDLSLIWHHLLDKPLPVPSVIINTVDRCYRAHLREDRIKLEHCKLV